jgi:hypothetical protein
MMMRRVWLPKHRLFAALLLLPLGFAGYGEALGQQPVDTSGTPVVVFIHGRGQTERTLDEVRSRFFGAFQNSQRAHFGAEILPTSALRFVWYADTIDPQSTAMPQSDTCRFAANTQVDSTFRTDLRRSLIRIAQRVGLNDIALNAFAGDTHKYLTRPAVRCEADARVSQVLFAPETAGRPIVVVAHSMGGIVAFSAMDRLSSTAGIVNRPKISQFITMGTQIGVTEILQGLQGSLVQVPVPVPNLIGEWANFQNESDALAFSTDGQFKATDPMRVPLDHSIRPLGDAHAIETYLGSPDVVVTITKAWCTAFRGQPPKECGLTQRSPAKTSAVSAIAVDDLRATVAALSHFFGVPPPALSISEAVPTEVRPLGKSFALTVNAKELMNFHRSAGARDSNVVLQFFLAHEIAHIAQAARPANDRQPSIVRECEADLWAGIALVNVRSFSGDPMAEFQKLNGAITAAAESGNALRLGVHSASRGASHPEAAQRAFCAARGLSAGLNMIRFRQIAASKGEAGLSAKSELWNTNPEELGPKQDPWEWSLHNARRIAVGGNSAGGVQSPMLGDQEMLRLAQAAERGPSMLVSAGVLVEPSQLAQCEYADEGAVASARCSVSQLPSDRLALESFEVTLAMLKPILLTRGWSSSSTLSTNAGTVATFHRGKAKSIARVDLTQGRVTVDFEVER